MYTKISFFLFLTLLLITGCKKSSNPVSTTTSNPGTANPVSIISFNDIVPFDVLNTGIISFQRIDSNNGNGVCIINARDKTTKLFIGDFGGPAISPDGSKIAFERNSHKNFWPFDIYIMDIDGNNLIDISDIDGQDFYPSWSPNSKNVLFYQEDSEYFKILYSVNINDIVTKNILYKSKNVFPCTPFSSFDSKNIVFSDGKDILCLDSELKTVTTLFTSGKGIPFTPRWSPDNKRIAFAVEKLILDTTKNIWHSAGGIIQIYDTELKEVSTIYEWDCENHIDYNGSNGLSVCWSPDGNKLLFNRTGIDVESHIYLINNDGSGLMQITNEPGVCHRSVSWSLE